MKIIHINATYGLGSTGHIVKDLHDYLLQNGEESYVFCGIKASSEKKEENVKIIGNSIDHKIHALLRRFSHKHGGHSVIATKKLCRQISDINPDVVHLHNLHSNYINLKVLLEYLAKRKISVVITLLLVLYGILHALFKIRL